MKIDHYATANACRTVCGINVLKERRPDQGRIFYGELERGRFDSSGRKCPACVQALNGEKP